MKLWRAREEAAQATLGAADGVDFGIGGAELHWVVTGFAIGSGVTLIAGRRRT